MEEKFTSKDFRLILVCLLIIAVGLAISLKYFYKVFPEASIDFKVTRAQAKVIAQKFLQEQGLDTKGYKFASSFGFDAYAKVYLEKELGLEKAQEYFGHPVKLWYWECRWFKPLQKEELQIQITPEGEIKRFTHLIPEEQAGDSLTAEQARNLAQDFLLNTMKIDTASLEFMFTTLQTKPHRLDHGFTYKFKGIEPAPESDYRINVLIQGKEVGYIYEYLRVPEKWEQSYSELRSYNETTSSIASLLIVLTIVAIIVVIFTHIRKREIRWKTAIYFGAVCFVLTFLTSLNMLPLYLSGYDTTASYSSFFIKTIAQQLLGALLYGVLIFLVTAGSETLYREKYGKFVSYSNLFGKTSLRSKSFFNGIVIGLAMTAFFFAYQVVFYLVANKFGAWAPADVPYSDFLNTSFPWLAVLLIGFLPAVSEEFISRSFSIPFLQKYGKSTLLAILVPAFIWGFGHSAYPNQPFYIRGLEVGFAGIIVGLIMLKWGILPCLVWHYTVDAFYTALLLFRSGNWYFILTAGVATGIMVIPLLIALIAYLRKGKFATTAEITNEKEFLPTVPEIEKPIEKVEAEEYITSDYIPLSSGVRGRGIILAILAIAIAIIPFHKLGENSPKFKISSSQAYEIADKFLISEGVEVAQMKKAIGITSKLNNETGKYFLQFGGLKGFNRLTGNSFPPNLWEVRRFTPGNREQWYVRINPETGEVFSFKHNFPEEMVGDSLNEDSARVLVETFLTQRNLDLRNYILKNSSSDKKPKRIDHYFTYEAKEGSPLNIEETKYWLNIGLAGDKISNYDIIYHLPEKWERERKGSNWMLAVFKVVKIASIAGFFALAVFYLYWFTKKGQAYWKKSALWAILPAFMTLLNGINFFPGMYYGYDVTLPWQMFSIQTIVAFIILVIVAYIQWFLGLNLLLSCFPQILTDFRKENCKIVLKDNIIVLILTIGFTFLYVSVTQAMRSGYPDWYPFKGISYPSSLEGPLPFLSLILAQIQRFLSYTVILSFFLFLWNGLLKQSLWRILAIILVIVALTPNEAKDIGEFIFSWAKVLTFLALTIILITRFLRDNTVLYSTAIVSYIIILSAINLLPEGGISAITSGVIALFIGFVVLLWIMFGWGRK